jgi:hypothetical protein
LNQGPFSTSPTGHVRILCPSSPQWLHLLIGPQFLGAVRLPVSLNPVLLYNGFAVCAFELVSCVRLERMPAAVRTLVSLRHDLPLGYAARPGWASPAESVPANIHCIRKVLLTCSFTRNHSNRGELRRCALRPSQRSCPEALLLPWTAVDVEVRRMAIPDPGWKRCTGWPR